MWGTALPRPTRTERDGGPHCQQDQKKQWGQGREHCWIQQLQQPSPPPPPPAQPEQEWQRTPKKKSRWNVAPKKYPPPTYPHPKHREKEPAAAQQEREKREREKQKQEEKKRAEAAPREREKREEKEGYMCLYRLSNLENELLHAFNPYAFNDPLLYRGDRENRAGEQGRAAQCRAG